MRTRKLYFGITKANRTNQNPNVTISSQRPNKEYVEEIDLGNYPKLEAFINSPKDIGIGSLIKGLNYHYCRKMFRIGRKRNQFHNNFYKQLRVYNLLNEVNGLCESIIIPQKIRA